MFDVAPPKEKEDVQKKTPRELCESLTRTLIHDSNPFAYRHSPDRWELLRRGKPMLAEIDAYLQEHPPMPQDDEIHHISTGYEKLREAILHSNTSPNL